jgi:hypothetical protein
MYSNDGFSRIGDSPLAELVGVVDPDVEKTRLKDPSHPLLGGFDFDGEPGSSSWSYSGLLVFVLPPR